MASSSTRMLLLGAVQLFEPVNGHQIRRELISGRVDEWADINPGSIYSGLETLARAGHLARPPLAEGRRTVTVFTTTVAGREEFQRPFAEAVRTHDRLWSVCADGGGLRARRRHRVTTGPDRRDPGRWTRAEARQDRGDRRQRRRLDVADGEVVAFLGPNVAGKTTTLRILTTLLKPTAGTATVAGHDVAAQAEDVRRSIGDVSQSGSTGSVTRAGEEVVDHGMLYGMGAAAARARGKHLFEQLDLDGLWTRQPRAMSGGQRRRLDIVMGLIHEPTLVFLGEPTKHVVDAVRNSFLGDFTVSALGWGIAWTFILLAVSVCLGDSDVPA